MKLKSLLLATASTLLVALTSCQKRDLELERGGDVNDPRMNTYITLSLNIGRPTSPTTRVATGKEDVDKHNPHVSTPHWQGRDKINELIVYVFNEDGSLGVKKSFAGEQVPAIDRNGTIKLDPWKTTVGRKTVYAIINPSAEIRTALETASSTLTDFQKAYQGEYDFLADDAGNEFETYYNSEANKGYKETLAGAEVEPVMKGYLKRYGMVKPTIAFTYYDSSKDDGTGTVATNFLYVDVIMMTGEPVTQEIQAYVSKEAAANGRNTIKLVLRRAVAQAIVTLNGDNYPTYYDRAHSIDLGADGAKLHRIKWSVQQHERKSYLYASSGSTATTTQSPKYAFKPSDTEPYDPTGYYHFPTNQPDVKNFDKWYDVATTDNNEGLPFTKATPVESLLVPTMWDGDPKNAPHFYSFPRFITETTHAYNADSYRKGNTAYFVVAGILEPGANQWGVGVTPPSDVTANYHLYKGAVDGLYYTTYEAAYKANNNGQVPTSIPATAEEAAKIGGDNIITYVGGTCYYIAYINPDVNDPTKWATSPVVRNNVYHMNIAGITKPGFSGIPLIPGGNNPLSPDPDDPVPSPTEVLKDTETHMATTVSVVGWSVHAFEMTF